MQSMMVTIDAKKLTVSQEGLSRRASGEACRYVCSHGGGSPRTGAVDKGIILYLEDYQDKASGNLSSGLQASDEVGRDSGHSHSRLPQQPVQSGRCLSVVLECLSTAAIIAMAVGALICFFSL